MISHRPVRLPPINTACRVNPLALTALGKHYLEAVLSFLMGGHPSNMDGRYCVQPDTVAFPQLGRTESRGLGLRLRAEGTRLLRFVRKEESKGRARIPATVPAPHLDLSAMFANDTVRYP